MQSKVVKDKRNFNINQDYSFITIFKPRLIFASQMSVSHRYNSSKFLAFLFSTHTCALPFLIVAVLDPLLYYQPISSHSCAVVNY